MHLLNSRDSELLDMLLTVCWHIYCMLTYSHKSPGPVHNDHRAKSMFSSPDTPRQSPHLLARQQSLRTYHGLVQVAGGYTQVYGVYANNRVILVTRPVTLNLTNSIKCVGDSCSYLSYARSLLCTPD